MIYNTTLCEMARYLKAAETILIFPHINLDGDALGSAAALCRVLRNMGKTAWILLQEEIPPYISFMDTEFCTGDASCIAEPDICMCVDCGEEKRLQHAKAYQRGKRKLCIDHHATAEGFGDHYYIDSGEAATCQLIYKLILELGAEMDKITAESIYTGLSTDTGSFQYSNTTEETHAIAAELFKKGIDHMGIVVKLYQTTSLKTLQLQAEILGRLQMLADGKAALSYVSWEMLEKCGASLDDAEGAIDFLRNIEGVEMAAFLKEKGDCIRVSMRAKSYANVHEIAGKFGGGGHAKAAGCTLHTSMEEAIEGLKQEIIAYWEDMGQTEHAAK